MKTMLARDEREESIDRAGDRLAYIAISYGLLAIVAYRSFVDREASWDLLALVVLGGLVGAGYRVANGALTRRAATVLGITGGLALVVAAVVLLLSR